MPAIISRAVDIDLPNRVWDWKETGKPRQLRRKLTAEERAALAARRDELEPWLFGYYASEGEDVAIALAEMIGSFPTPGQSDAQIASKVESLRRKLADYPKWAIERVCDRLSKRGYTKEENGRFVQERTWAPADPVLINMIENELKLYKQSFDSAVQLLTAGVAS